MPAPLTLVFSTVLSARDLPTVSSRLCNVPIEQKSHFQLLRFGKALPPPLTSKLSCKPALELFPGSESWSSAHSAAGFSTVVHNWKNGACPDFDMCDDAYFSGRLMPSLHRRTFSAVHIGCECTTFSTATGGLYRTFDDPLGTYHGLAHSDQRVRDKTLSGTKYGTNSLNAFEAADAAGSLTSLEQPLGSSLLELPAGANIKRRIAAGSLYLFKTSYCRWGRRFRGTRMIITNCKALEALERSCCHSSHSTILAFHATDTKNANSYPKRLVRAWAAITRMVVTSKMLGK